MVSNVAEMIANTVIMRALSGRPSLVKKARVVLLTLTRIETATKIVAEALLKGAQNKKPKVPLECIKILTVAYEEHGAHSLPTNLMLVALKDLIEVRSREEEISFAFLIYPRFVKHYRRIKEKILEKPHSI